MSNTYIPLFVRKYGTRDGLILSELCQKEFESRKEGPGFSKHDCENVLPFLTGKQIRSGINNLLKNGCIEFIPNASFDRTAKYRIKQDVFNQYIKTLLEDTKAEEKSSAAYPHAAAGIGNG